MEFEKFVRLSKVLRELNISLDRAVDFLNLKGIKIEARPTTKISNETYKLLLDNFDDDKSSKVESNEVLEEKRKEKEIQRIKLEEELKIRSEISDNQNINNLSSNSNSQTEIQEKKVLNKNLNFQEKDKIESSKDTEKNSATDDSLTTKYKKLSGPVKTGETINLQKINEKQQQVDDNRKRKRKRISKEINKTNSNLNPEKKKIIEKTKKNKNMEINQNS